MKKITALIITVILLCFVVACDKKEEYNSNVTPKQTYLFNNEEDLKKHISFETNGGTEIEPIRTISLEVPPETSKEGYTFEGWYLDKDLTTKATFPLDPKEDITLYAKWNQIFYSVYFESNGGTKINDIKVTYNEEIKNIPTPIKNNNVFKGWFTNSSFTQPAVFPMKITKDTRLYAKWLTTSSTSKFDDCRIKYSSEYYSEVSYSITPTGLDLNELSKEDYTMNITVSFDVRYEKDYNVILGIGYMGAPKYEVSLYDSSNRGNFREDQKTTTYSQTKTISMSQDVTDIKNKKITFEVSTNNIQNIIYFENITVTYDCVK